MAKKNKKNARSASRSKHGSNGGSAQQATSLTRFRAERAVDSIAHDFITWFEADFGPAEEALDCLNVSKALITAYFEATATGVATAFKPDALAAVALQLVDVGGEEEVAEVLDMFHLYVDFLHDTGRWTGTEEEYDGVHSILTRGGADDPGATINVPALSKQEELALFRALPLIQRARALLTWIGEGRPVTGTGVLRLKDIEAAAACVGVAAKGVRKRNVDELAEGTVLVQSMRQVEVLHHIWATLVETEMIDVLSTKGVPFEGRVPFLDGSADEQLEECRFFVSEFLRLGVLGGDPDEQWAGESAGLTLGILLAGAAGNPTQVERFLISPAHAPEGEELMVQLLARLVHSRLTRWAGLGIVDLDTHFRVPPVVIACVAMAFEDKFNLQVVYPPDYEHELVVLPVG
ncbi:hypothetical protein [Arthrobacter sp. H5]|uniref:hypothetical protein n=1 Tax=Arthrobacter sp. H5 TaxID=1267973 RepID=UPI00048948D6|nr:hypothetical protein [Arthrobacter sp. H5]